MQVVALRDGRPVRDPKQSGTTEVRIGPDPRCLKLKREPPSALGIPSGKALDQHPYRCLLEKGLEARGVRAVSADSTRLQGWLEGVDGRAPITSVWGVLV